MDSEAVVNMNRRLKNRRGKVTANKTTKIGQKQARIEQARNCSSNACAVNWKPGASVQPSGKES